MTALTKKIDTLLRRSQEVVPCDFPQVQTCDFCGVDPDVQVNFIQPMPAPVRPTASVVMVDTSDWTLDEMLQVAG